MKKGLENVDLKKKSPNMSCRKAAKLFGKIVESAEVKEDNRHEEDGSALERVRRRNNGHIEEETRQVVMCDFDHHQALNFGMHPGMETLIS